MVIYGEYLFAENFIAGLLLILLTGKVAGYMPSAARALAAAVLCGISLIPPLSLGAYLLYFHLFRAPELGVIGGADGPTVILTSGAPLFPGWIQPVLTAGILVICIFLAFRVRHIERSL